MSEQPPASGGQPQYPPPAAPYAAPQMASPYGKASGPRAGFWKRFLASFVDGLIIGVPAWIVVALVVGVHFRSTKSDGTVSAAFNGSLIVAGLLVGVVTAVYFTLLDGGPRGQSIGKRAAGIRVVDAGTGASIGYGRGLVRALGKFVSNFLMNLCFIGLLDYLWMLWDSEKQTLHDKVARSYVVPVEAYPVQ